MRIVVDARMLFWTGVGRYTKALLEAYEAHPGGDQFIVLRRPADAALWQPRAAHMQVVDVNINPYTVAEQTRLPGIIAALKPDLVHFTTPNAACRYGGTKVVSLHDLTLFDYDTSRGTGLKKWLRGLKRIPFRWIVRHSVRSATHILTMSEYVANQVHERFAVPTNRISTTWLAADSINAKPASIERFGLPKRFLLYVGNAYPYKNIASSVRALSKLGPAYDDVHLAIGGKPDSYTSEITRLADELGVSERVHVLGFVSDGELVTLYREAAAYLYPSFSEGFGLQGLEAMSQGLVVLAARASCLPEVYGEAAAYFDPANPTEQAEVIVRVLEHPEVAAKLRAAGQKRLTMLSWAKTAEKTRKAYAVAARTRS